MKHLFGPVNSRRFGLSLGIDLSSTLKQCNFDCLYCELKPSKAIKTQQHIVPAKEILIELQDALLQFPETEAITVTANGEPTLYPNLKELLSRIDVFKGNKKTLLLSNSTGLLNPETYALCMLFDQVKLSLDAVSEKTFKKIDRPHSSIKVHDIIKSMQTFSQEYEGTLFIEILFVKGINDSLEEVERLNEVLLTIPCTRIDIGTIDRPPAYKVNALSYNELFNLSLCFDESLNVTITTKKKTDEKQLRYTTDEILQTLSKRPLSEEDIHELFDKNSQEHLNTLLSKERIERYESQGRVFFRTRT